MLTTLWRYTLLAWLLLPLAFLRLLWRSRRLPGYRHHWEERLGFYPMRSQRPVIWLHAVSVGETRAAAPLIRLIRERYPEHQVVLTHMTPTGRTTAPEMIGDEVLRCYLPYDLPFAVRRFLDHFAPRVGILLETEIWPNLIQACASRHLPLLLVNARLSGRSAERYRPYEPLIREAFSSLTLVAAQTVNDALRFTELGARETVVAGNLKFDAPPPPPSDANVAELQQLLGSRRIPWLAASTRPGEERLLLELLPQITLPGGLLILVPRHPQRFNEVAALLQRMNIPFVRRSERQPVSDQVRVLLGDSMGELQAWYRVASVAVIGGSLLPFGGQNLIEATAVGCPVIVGPHTYNFLDATEWAISAGAAIRVSDLAQLPAQLTGLLEHPDRRQVMGTAGRQFTLQHQGAARNILSLIERHLPALPA